MTLKETTKHPLLRNRFLISIHSRCRSQWLHSLRHELFSPAQTLGLWDRIPLESWMFVCICSVLVLSCVQVAALRRADPPSKEPYWLCKRSRNWKNGQGPTKGCRPIDREICSHYWVMPSQTNMFPRKRFWSTTKNGVFYAVHAEML
jgi:hypothetical protein